MAMGWVGPALLLALTGCSSSQSNEGSGGSAPSCAARTGNYLAHFVERPGGSCGQITDAVAPAGEHPAGCQGTDQPSADNCSIDVNQTCPLQDGGTLEETGTSHWSVDGSKGTAVITITRKPAAGASCTSTYDVTFTKA